MHRNGLILLLVLFGLTKSISAQNCFLPVLTNFSNPTTSGFTLQWVDNNPVVSSYEIEFGLRGFNRTGLPSISDIQTTEYSLSGLEAGTAYEIYLRTICSVGDSSQWNGPYFYNTAISNDGTCDLSLPINDNNCPQGQDFLISVEGFDDFNLGENLILEKVRLIVDHPWPPDLEVRLISPNNIPVTLSQYNGSGVDHYGNPQSVDCSESLVFSDNACLAISELEPPLIGDVRPEVPLATVFDGQSPNGMWSLFICDRADNDIGELKGVELVFSEEACTVPDYIAITDIESDNITLRWEDNGCENLRFSFKKIEDPISETTSEFKECNVQEYQILGLEPNTDYELTVLSVCDEDSNSPLSCVYYFTTSCANSNFLSDFDIDPLCQPVCDQTCNIEGVWFNDKNDDSDWIVNLGPTLTSFSGPSGDKNIRGRYIYIENQPTNCTQVSEINLITNCLRSDGQNQCNLSFYYHMFGQDIGTLTVEYTQDSTQWVNLFSLSGDQGDGWKFASIEVPSFNYGRLRFSAKNSPGALRGDIALDHIKLIGIDTIHPVRYFVDSDSDGFGSPAEFILSCSSSIPPGYVDNEMDCNDNDERINPAAPEIPCNGIDENCNGNDDDVSPDDIQFTILQQEDESCAGSLDGLIEINIVQATPPVEVVWSNLMTGTTLSELGAGVYYATITDSNLCSEELGPIILEAKETLVYNVIRLTDPVCSGVNDGIIEVAVAGGSGEYTVNWSDGQSGSLRTELMSGTYTATITDSENCSIITDPIVLDHGNPIVAGISLRRDVSCFGQSNGLLQLAANGGNLPYTIRWNTGDSTFLLTNLEAGSYEVTVEDSDGCQTILENILVDEPAPLDISVDNIEHITCPDGFDSFVDISVEGGTKPYTYLWSNGNFSEDIFNVRAGNYSLTVSDFNACTFTISDIIINEPAPVEITLDSINSVNCVGSNRGYIEVSTTGGNPPYIYNWSVNESDANSQPFLDSLGPGLYFLTVVDDFGCKSKPETFEIFNEDVPINIALNQIQDNLCFGDSIAAISAVSTGVEIPLDFNWSNGSQEVKNIVADTIFGLKAGKYNLTITDREGCVGVADSIEIVDPEELQYAVLNISDNLCFGDSTGQINIEVQGGTEPYDINWSNGGNGNLIDNLQNGDYSFNLLDQNNCELSGQNIIVSSPEQLELDAILIHPTEQTLGSIQVLVSGGESPFQFIWTPPVGSDSLVQNLMMGDYELQLIDNNGCQIDTVFTLDLINSVEEFIEELEVFPNPADQNIFIRGLSTPLKSISLVDVIGNRYNVRVSIDGDKYTLNISTLPSGFYYLLIELENKQMLVHPLIIIH